MDAAVAKAAASSTAEIRIRPPFLSSSRYAVPGSSIQFNFFRTGLIQIKSSPANPTQGDQY